MTEFNSNRPIVCAITRGDAADSDFEAAKSRILTQVEAAVEFGIQFVQIREKQLSPRCVFDLTAAAASIAAGSPTKILVNEHAGIALAAGASGAHLRSDGQRPAALRAQWPRPFVIGVSTHAVDEIIEAKSGGADFAVFGPVFASPGKGAPIGLDALRDAQIAAGEFPVLALGGVDETNWRECLKVARGFAAIRFLADRDGMKSVGEYLKQ